MAFVELRKVAIVGTAAQYALAEDALTALKCMEVERVEREAQHFVIEGWLPDAWLDELSFVLDSASGGLVVLARVEDAPPAVTLLRNPSLARPFERLVELFAMPGRSGFDPTLATFLVLPLFFGFVIGDAGHGALVIAAGAFLWWRVRTPVGRLAATILLVGGAWSVAFGLLVFGEAFSFPIPFARPLLHKLGDPTKLLLLSIAVGALHVGLGVLIGFVVERRRVGLRAAALTKLSWLVLEAGAVILALSFLGLANAALRPLGWGLAGLAVLVLGIGGGLVPVLEVPSFLTNVTSYVRLAALGIADGYFGATINQGVLSAFAPWGAAGVVLGVLALAALHLLLLGLAVVIATLHALRLHYVEFYTKFYPLGEDAAPERVRRFAPSAPFHARAEPATPVISRAVAPLAPARRDVGAFPVERSEPELERRAR